MGSYAPSNIHTTIPCAISHLPPFYPELSSLSLHVEYHPDILTEEL